MARQYEQKSARKIHESVLNLEQAKSKQDKKKQLSDQEINHKKIVMST
jgi:hypothetical protein